MSVIERDEERLLHAVAQILHANGQQSDETVGSITKLADHMGRKINVIPNWDGLILVGKDGFSRNVLDYVVAVPKNIAMNRVADVGRVIEEVVAERVPAPVGLARIHAASALAPLPDVLFALACAGGAAALSVTFGVTHFVAVMLIFLSAGVGGFLRRVAGRLGANAFAQAFLASALAGLIGAFAVRNNISSDLRLIAVCPCMVLVPGPHLLNGTLDLLAGRVSLGAARIVFAIVVLASITAGLLFGLASLGVTLPPAPASREVVLWPIIVAGGVAAASYSVFFSLPPRLLGWPIITAMIVDATRWIVMGWLHAGPVLGAGVAGLVAGLLLVPVARAHTIPFAGIGFASIVSLMPGVLVFRMTGGLLQLQSASPDAVSPLLEGTITDGLTAILVIAAITIGVVIPKHAFDIIDRWAKDRRSL